MSALKVAFPNRTAIFAGIVLTTIFVAPAVADDMKDYEGPVVTSCDGVGALAAQWDKDYEQWPEIFLEADVKAVHPADPIAVTELCPGQKLQVICLEYDNTGLTPGRKVEVSGLLTDHFDGGVIIDPCSATLKQ